MIREVDCCSTRLSAGICVHVRKACDEGAGAAGRSVLLALIPQLQDTPLRFARVFFPPNLRVTVKHRLPFPALLMHLSIHFSPLSSFVNPRCVVSSFQLSECYAAHRLTPLSNSLYHDLITRTRFLLYPSHLSPPSLFLRPYPLSVDPLLRSLTL